MFYEMVIKNTNKLAAELLQLNTKLYVILYEKWR